MVSLGTIVDLIAADDPDVDIVVVIASVRRKLISSTLSRKRITCSL